MRINEIYCGDALEVLKTFPDECINMCCTSPPYFGLRDYQVVGQIGLEETPGQYVQRLVEVFREVKRVLKKDGTLWVVIGDSYNGSGKGTGMKREKFTQKQQSNLGSMINSPTKIAGLKPKDLIGIPWMVAFALRDDGWYLRSDIIWYKKNPMPEPIKDRPTKSHEYIFLLSKSQKYYYNYEAIAEKSEWFDLDNRSKTCPTISKRSELNIYKCNRQGVYNEKGIRNKRRLDQNPRVNSGHRNYPDNGGQIYGKRNGG